MLDMVHSLKHVYLKQCEAWEITHLQVGIIMYLCRVILADWSVEQHTFAVECFIISNSIRDIQQAFQHEFSNDCATGPTATR